MVERYKYKCIDAYEEPENPMEWLPCPRCGLRPLVWEFDNGRATACGCGTDCYSHWSVQAESIMSVIKRSDNGKSAEAYEGKMWKANRGGIWYLYWYDHDDNPSMIKIERREILLLN